jgi:hypothetical protein
MRKHNLLIVESMIVIIKAMLISYSGLPNKLISNLLKKLVIKNNYFIGQFEDAEKVIELVFKNFREVNCKGRRILEGFTEMIKKAYEKHCALPTIKPKKNMVPIHNPFPECYSAHFEDEGKLVLGQVRSHPRKLDILLEGYSSIDSLANDVDFLLYLFKHKQTKLLNHENYMVLLSQLIEVMEYEIEIFNDTVVNDKNTFATKYMLVEKLHISHNKIHDIYSSTKYPHRLFNLSFEKKEKREKYITKGNSKTFPSDSEYTDFYYETYIEGSLKSQVETRHDYDTYLNELFPNHDQHVELMILILNLFSSSVKVLDDYIAGFDENISEKKIKPQIINQMKFRINVLMMA